jgi:DNA-binding transcriptional ArsR family regulator
MNEVLKALADPTRREILRLLQERDMSAGELAEHFDQARSTLSGHFNVLKEAGLILPERRGTTILYSLNISVFEEAVGGLLELLGSGGEGWRGS